MDGERRINLRFAAKRFQKLDEKRSKQKTTFQEIGVRLFENWLAGDSEQATRSSLRRPAEPIIEKLGVVLASDDKGLIKMLEMAIESSYGLLQHSLSQEDIERLKAAAYGEGKRAISHSGSEVVVEGPTQSRRRPRRSA
jgi:hypothetical protein